MPVACNGGGTQWVLFDWVEDYFECDMPLVALGGAEFRMVCWQRSRSALALCLLGD